MWHAPSREDVRYLFKVARNFAPACHALIESFPIQITPAVRTFKSARRGRTCSREPGGTW